MSFYDETVSQATNIAQAPAVAVGMRLPLSRVEKGVPYKIVKISGRDETKKHLSDLGFVVNADVKVVNAVSGNLVCDIKGVRVGLDEALAARITVVG